MTRKQPKTLGELRASGWRSRALKEEMRENLVSKLKKKQPICEGIIGYDQTVLPQLQNAILSRHHFILLGLRGQAKTQIVRRLIEFLDEYSPAIADTELNENPYAPLSPRGKAMIRKYKDNTPLVWRHREERYSEKLATPDVSMADLIGDIDPIKAAREKLDISNPEIIHWGIIPRTNRGIFAINEVPDLQSRIQVGLLNILEESDIQVRGFPIRLPLDLLLVFTANPEDYTNRGNLITPLKDRIDSQILTHYPETLEEAKQITNRQCVYKDLFSGIPNFLTDIVEEIAFQARKNEYIDQASGVSVRLSIAALENLYSNVQRRGFLYGYKNLTPRMMDIYATIPAITGKIELVHEGDQAGSVRVAMTLIGQAIQHHFLKYFPDPNKNQKEDQSSPYESFTQFFNQGGQVLLSDEMTQRDYQDTLMTLPGAADFVKSHLPSMKDKWLWLGVEFLLEGMHHNQLISRKIDEGIVRFENTYSRFFKNLEEV